MPIRTKLFSGFMGLAILAGILGLYAQRSERDLGLLAFRIYDDAFLGTTHLRSAQAGFLNLAHSQDTAETGSDRATMVLDDLGVASAHAMSAEGRAAASNLHQSITDAFSQGEMDPAKSRVIEQGFERLVDIFAGDGFRYRRGFGRLISVQVQRTSEVIGLIVLIALGITFLLTQAIARPIRRAVGIAEAISAGHLNNAIVAEGEGETAELLRAMSTMQERIAQAIDCSERRATEARLAYEKRHDGLTGLPNRLLLIERLKSRFLRRIDRESVVLLYLNLGRFKLVNATLGLAAGDALLRLVADRLRLYAAGSDLVVRLAGDQLLEIRACLCGLIADERLRQAQEGVIPFGV